MTKNKLAFSLVELAVVILIIGLITAGIIQGTSLVNSSRLSSARSLTVQSRINEIAGLTAWYETSMIESLRTNQASNASQISEWRDISPGSIAQQKNTLTRIASSAVSYKSEGINKIPSIQFTTLGSLSLATFYQGPLGRSTIFVVMRPTIAPSSTNIMTILDSNSSSSNNSYFGIVNNKLMLNLGILQGTATISNAPSFVVNSNYILAIYYDSSNAKAFVNNATSMAGGALIAAGSNSLNGLTIGNNLSNNASTQFTGLISEIIIYDRLLSNEERQSVMSYLSKKYKITVSGI